MAINNERDDNRRDYDSPRDRSRNYGYERGPRSSARDAPRGRSYSNVTSVMGDVDRLAYSLTRAGARACFGTVGALGDFVVNLADSIYASPQAIGGRERYRNGDRVGNGAPRDRYDRADRYDRSDRYDRTDRDDNRGRGEGGRSLSSDLSGSLRQAIRDTADVWTDSVREFSQVFHDEQERDDEIDARVAAAEDEAAAARPDRPRPRTRPAAPPEGSPPENDKT